MTIKTIVKPETGLAGKSYGLHVESNLLVMLDPTWEDVKACRGLLIETARGWEWYVGRAFLDLVARVRKEVGREPTFVDVKTSACRKRHYNGVMATVRSSSDYSVGIARATIGFSADEVPQTFVNAYAVPHRALAGRGASCITPGMRLLTSPVADASFAGPRAFTCGPVVPSGHGHGTFEPVGWMLGALASKLRYSEAIDKIVSKMEDVDDIRSKVKSGVTAYLKKLGVDVNSYVLLPYFVTSDGRAATDIAIAKPQIARSGNAPALGYGGDKVVPFLGGRLCFGDGDYESFPLARGTDIFGLGTGVWLGYQNANGTPGSLDQVTTPLKAKIGEFQTMGIVGCQPFGAFFSLNDSGAFSPKLVDEGVMTDNDWLRWTKFGYDLDSTRRTPTQETPTETYQQQGESLIASVASTGGREERSGFTAADTWMVTIRQLVRLCWDPISIEGTSGAWLESKANGVMSTPMANGSILTDPVTI